MEVRIRGAQEGDTNFIMSTWLKGQYYGSSYHLEMDADAYFKAHSETVANMLLNPSNSLRVAFAEDGEGSSDLILGYACIGWASEQPVIHWLYVKNAFRKQGIAKKLLEGVNAKIVTNITNLGNEIRKNKEMVFNPYAK